MRDFSIHTSYTHHPGAKCRAEACYLTLVVRRGRYPLMPAQRNENDRASFRFRGVRLRGGAAGLTWRRYVTAASATTGYIESDRWDSPVQNNLDAHGLSRRSRICLGRGMSRNVNSAFVNENLYAEYKMSSRTIPSHPKLCGGRGTRTHKSLRTTVFKTAFVLFAASPRVPASHSQ